MKKILFVILIFISSGVFAGDGWTDLFNGKDLKGWNEINGTAKYEVKDGEIVGTTVLGSPNSFLTNGKIYKDFILELDLKVDENMNSGIQFRSESTKEYNNGRVHGYQCEVDPAARAWSGGIYDEARRGWLYPMCVNPKGRKAFKNGEWNHYRIEAVGSSMRTWVNGIPCADLIDDMTPEGFIALQVHSIGNNKSRVGEQIKWKNIRIKTENLKQSPWTDIKVINNIPNYLSPQEIAQGWELLFDGETNKGWRGAGLKSFPKQGWHIENGELVVEQSGGAESQNGGDIVTNDEYSTFEFQLDFKISKGANSGIKYFITEGYESGKSAIGLEFQILDDQNHPDAKLGTDGNRTMGSLYDLIPAYKKKTVNGIGKWNHAYLVVEGTRHEEWIKGSGMQPSDFVGAHVEHWLNNRRVLSYERGTQSFEALVKRSKYTSWKDFGMWQKGHILLQDHGCEVHFRSIKIRKLNKEEMVKL